MQHTSFMPIETIDDSIDMLRHALRHATLPGDEWPSVEEAWADVLASVDRPVGTEPGMVRAIRTDEPEPDDHGE